MKKKQIMQDKRRLDKKDYIIIIILVLIYAVFSFYKLGDFKAPRTYYSFKGINDSIVLSLEKIEQVGKIRFYTGYSLANFSLYISNDNLDYKKIMEFNSQSVFSWEDIQLNNEIQFIKIITNTENACIGDIAIYDTNYNRLKIDSYNKELIDEEELVPEQISYMNSTYFDEIYYARSAYEYVNGIDVYEWTHPPIGKLLMTIPIIIFGFSPFNYRLMGNIAGLLIIPTMYLLGKEIFKERKWAILSAILITFDNFHLAHSRIALVDSFLILFIILSVLFMKYYISIPYKENSKKQFKYLLLSGIFIGLAIATKWNGVYAGIGLAIVFFTNLFYKYKNEIISIIKDKKSYKYLFIILNFLITIPFSLKYLLILISEIETAKISVILYYMAFAVCLIYFFYKSIFKDKYLLKLSIICIISFILIPIIIQILAYRLFPTVANYDGTLLGIIEQNKLMYNYHSKLDATHPFSSKWYEWPIIHKPVWYYGGETIDGATSTITGIGNPIIWWGGLLSLIYTIIKAKKKDASSIFILTFIISTYVPYIFIGRIMFLYHYYITLPFIMLSLVNAVKWVTKKAESDIVYNSVIALVIVGFIIFYPISSGLKISNEYIDSLKWFDTWWF